MPGACCRCAVGASEAALQEVMKQDLVMNVYRNGQWGSYRHIVLPQGTEANINAVLIVVI